MLAVWIASVWRNDCVFACLYACVFWGLCGGVGVRERERVRGDRERRREGGRETDIA